MAAPGSGITGPPKRMRQNETPYWQDVPYTDKFNNQYDSGSYALQYAFAGPSQGAVVVAAVAAATNVAGQGWVSQFTPAQAAQMLPGLYKWQAILTGLAVGFSGSISGTTLTVTVPPALGALAPNQVVTGPGVAAGTVIVSGSGLSWVVNNPQSVGAEALVAQLPTRIVPLEGNTTVEVDLATVSGTYDGRTTMQVGLANCEAALTVFQASGGAIKAYNIAGRSMTFQDLKEIRDLCDWFRARVQIEEDKLLGGDSRNIRVGFAPPSSGVPASSSKNWPWW